MDKEELAKTETATKMEQVVNYIVFQCYGHEGIFHECAYALLSLSRQYGGGGPAHTEVWIYTDNAEWFNQFRNCGLQLRFAKIDADKIKAWRGTIDFVHRVKIEVLKDFSRERNGNILYLDTDVVFLQPVEPLFAGIAAGHLYMHVMEGIVSSRANPIFSKLDAYLREYTPMQVHGKPLWDLAMWNAGVLGFHSKFRYLLDEVLTFTDTEYPRFPKHVVEQFAFSVFFRQAAPIRSSAFAILHYWNLKEARMVLASFFGYFKNSSWAELCEQTKLVQMHVLMQEKMNFLASRDITDKLLKKTWQPTEYVWRDMMTQI